MIRGAAPKAVAATSLTHTDLHAHNTFDQRLVVVPETKNVDVMGKSLVYTFPPASVTKLSLTLA